MLAFLEHTGPWATGLPFKSAGGMCIFHLFMAMFVNFPCGACLSELHPLTQTRSGKLGYCHWMPVSARLHHLLRGVDCHHP